MPAEATWHGEQARRTGSLGRGGAQREEGQVEVVGGGDAPWRLFGTEAQLNQSGVLGALHKPLT